MSYLDTLQNAAVEEIDAGVDAVAHEDLRLLHKLLDAASVLVGHDDTIL